ncbi:amidohydrolase family protein [Amycolatopsis rubida]|uniref:6-methylsalicylate decarboxylase n=1 Tax=Amycolatopsis rubida TaxID=112413 RepID=A0A1I5KJW1_9PSEU|nr:amidohydrolase family protein [Amycolatopsis rubida]SFO84926.1 Predicted metal-dependent hydrolase, TIM-barrel fold [Amycolatopsis rubida]
MTAEPLVDVHSHFVTPRYVEAAIAAGHRDPDGMPAWPSWNVREHLGLMDRAGIGTALLSVSSPGTHFGDDAAARALTREVNEFAAGHVRDHPGRFGHFANLPLPDVDGALAELAYALDTLGSDGVAVETNAHGRYLADPAFEPVWAELDRRRAVVFVHPTSPPAHEAVSLGLPRPLLEFIFDSARAATDLLLTGTAARYPGIAWIFPHGGGALPLLADRLELFRTAFGPDAPPVRERLAEFWFDLAGTPFPRQVPALTAAVGTARLLYGSDSCWTPVPAVLRQVASIDAAGPQWRTLTTANARRLFPRLAR